MLNTNYFGITSLSNLFPYKLLIYHYSLKRILMKRPVIILSAAIALSFAACTTKETKETTTIETVEVPVSPPVDEPIQVAPTPAPAPEKDNKFELELSD